MKFVLNSSNHNVQMQQCIRSVIKMSHRNCCSGCHTFSIQPHCM